MTNLIRARGTLSEMAQTFDAESEPHLSWSDPIWPGETALVVTATGIDRGASRRLSPMRWSLPALVYSQPPPAKQRGAIFTRDLIRDGRLAAPDRLARCLNILEAFAYPVGETGRCTRSWFGLSDHPLAAWAGLCTVDGSGFAGLLTTANTFVAPVSPHMPWLLTPAGQAAWLRGDGPLSLPAPPGSDHHYHENLGERWSTGALDDALSPLLARLA